MRDKNNYRQQIRFFIRVILPGIMAFFLFAALIMGILIPGFEKAMMERKQETTRELTRSAWSILEHYNRLERSGEMSREEAMTSARNAVKELRYGDESKDYFWITDRKPRMIMHPYRPDLDGQDLGEFRDPDGKALFVEMVEVTDRSGEGFVDYRWQWKDDSLRIVPKLSYVTLFKPWDWIIGTGIYVEDVKTGIRQMEKQAVLISGSIGLLIILLLVIITRQSHRIELRRRKAEYELRESRERYKALAEAASEGVMIWSNQGIHANRTLTAWTGFTDEELASKNPGGLITGSGIEKFTDPAYLYEELSNRMISDCSLCCKDGTVKNIHADFSRILISGDPAVLMVARPVQVSHEPAAVPFGDQLIETSETAFFRATYGKRSRFLSANPAMTRLIGYHSQEEAESSPVDRIFGDPDEYRMFSSLIETAGQSEDLVVRIRRKDGSESWVLMNARVREDIPGERWIEGMAEPLAFAGSGVRDSGSPLQNLDIAVLAADGSLQDCRDLQDLQDAWTGLPENIIKRISIAGTEDALREEYQRSVSLAGSLIKGDLDPVRTVHFISWVADAICRKVVELAIGQSGPPPAAFAVMQLGSAGRGEQTLATDQDNALIYEDVPADKEDLAREYFLQLGSTINYFLAETGYHYCQGRVMAGNPKWCQPLSQWKDYFLNWTRNPGPDELLEISIFFDFEFAAGQEELVGSLREFIRNQLKANDIFFLHMANAWKPFAPGRMHAGSEINLKKILMPITGLVRMYAMKHGIAGPGTPGKIIGLYKSGVFSKEMLRGLLQAWKLLMKLRLASQHGDLVAGREPGNALDPGLLDPVQEYLLGKAIRSIEDLMLMAANEFNAGV
jgi:PAS domain S-box-containing protein